MEQITRTYGTDWQVRSGYMRFWAYLATIYQSHFHHAKLPKPFAMRDELIHYFFIDEKETVMQNNVPELDLIKVIISAMKCNYN